MLNTTPTPPLKRRGFWHPRIPLLPSTNGSAELESCPSGHDHIADLQRSRYDTRMLPAGYLLKRVAPPPGWLDTETSHIKSVCSVADCVNDNVVDVQTAWQHNSFGLANAPSTLTALASQSGSDSEGSILFYYTGYEYELPSDGWTFDASQWRPRSPAPSSAVSDAVEPPSASNMKLLGYDVVVFEDYLSHSPLTCNSVAKDLTVNEHCLLDSLEEALAAIDSGAFGGGCEEGIYTIFSVYRVGSPNGS